MSSKTFTWHSDATSLGVHGRPLSGRISGRKG
jgi:hypothetical protein